jgi:hypothetical protein
VSGCGNCFSSDQALRKSLGSPKASGKMKNDIDLYLIAIACLYLLTMGFIIFYPLGIGIRFISCQFLAAVMCVVSCVSYDLPDIRCEAANEQRSSLWPLPAAKHIEVNNPRWQSFFSVVCIFLISHLW